MTSSMYETAIDNFQKEQWEWSQRNFDAVVGWREALEPLSGVAEELGEFMEAAYWDYPRKRDAAADATVYLTDVCNRLEFKLEDLWPDERDDPKPLMVAEGLLVHLGRLNHAVLKMAQNIRQEKNHEADAKAAITGILSLLISATPTCLSQSFFPGIVSPVWEKVRHRNWKPERETGDTSQRNAE